MKIGRQQKAPEPEKTPEELRSELVSRVKTKLSRSADTRDDLADAISNLNYQLKAAHRQSEDSLKYFDDLLSRLDYLLTVSHD